VRTPWLALALAFAGCSPGLRAELFAPQFAKQLPPSDASKYPSEVLHYSDRYLFYANQDRVYSQWSVHSVTRVLTEAGRDVASVKQDFSSEAALVELTGQVIGKDGSVVEFDPAQAFWTKDDAKEGGRTHLAFQLPNAHAGSVLEYSFVVRVPGLWLENERWLNFSVPYRHYELDVAMSKRVVHYAGAFNTAQPFEGFDRDGLRHVRWAVDELQPLPKEDFAGEDRFAAPWWVFLLHSWQWGTSTYALQATFKDALEREAKVVDVDEKWTKGFVPSLDVSGCADVKCKVERAFREVHRLTDYTGAGEFWKSRPLKDVVASKTASGFEQTLLFRKLLASAGVTSDSVFVVRHLSVPFDERLPFCPYNEAVAWVGPQPGLALGYFVDASCERCRPGEVRGVIEGAKGVMARGIAHALGDPKVEAEVVEVRGTGRPRDAHSRQATLEVTESGDLRVTELRLFEGALAWNWRQGMRLFKQEQLRAAEETNLARRAPGAQLESWALPTCDKDGGPCRQTVVFKVAAGATRVGDRLLVPLSAFDDDYAATFTQPTRQRDLIIEGDAETSSALEVHAPPGYAVKELVADATAEGAGFSSDVTARATKEGAVVERSLKLRQGSWQPVDYQRARAAVRAYSDVRTRSLVFVKAAPAR
jgi:hypothetical protein